MALKDTVFAAAEQFLAAAASGLTIEALAREVAKHVGRQLPPNQVASALRERPQRFVEGSDGRWRLRSQIVTAETSAPAEQDEAQTAPQIDAVVLRRGCYVVFDLEAIGQDATAPDTEIIQIAAQRYVDGQPEAPWVTFVRPSHAIPPHIIALTKIGMDEVRDAPLPTDALNAFFAYVGDLPLVAHNGASYDGPLLRATCQRLGVPVPPSFRVLDTLPLARALLPMESNHKVGTLAERFGCARPDAHRADADVEMLAGVIDGLQREIASSSTGAAAYELWRRAGDDWAAVLSPPAHLPMPADITATFGWQITPLLPERQSAMQQPVDAATVDAAFARIEALGRSRRPAQVELAQLAGQTMQQGGYAVIEAGTGTGKSLGYLLPAALVARSTGQTVAASTFTRVLQTQLVDRELPFVQQIVPGLTYAQLQGRANYLSLSRLAEEIEDAWGEDRITRPRAWMLATLVRFAERSVHGNLEEMGYTPQSLDDYLQTDGATLQVLASVRASGDDRQSTWSGPDFYRRARANAEQADVVIVNHALLLRSFLQDDDDEPFAARVVCDEAHTLEDAATLALEQRVDERVLRRILRAIDVGGGRSGLVADCRRRLGLPADDATLQTLARAVDDAQAALESLAAQLYRYATSQTVVGRADLERYGVRVPISGGALAAAGGPALRTAAETLLAALGRVRAALAALLDTISTAPATTSGASAGRRIMRVVRGLLRDLRDVAEPYDWFWSFRDSSSYVRIVELARIEGRNKPDARPTVSISGVPINVGPQLWAQFWSRLEAAVCTSATITVFGQGFDFFLGRIGLEQFRVDSGTPPKTLVTHELPHAFNYHERALLMLPNDLPAPRDTELKRNFPLAVANFLRRFIPFFGGKTLGLFTANSRRDLVYEELVAPMTEAGFPVLAQGHGSLKQLLDDFRAEVESTLLGSRSLWEGVDVPGASLSYVFLEKLPYPSLGDPVEAARMNAVEQAGGNAFAGYLLPKMIIVLKQGFGRLIRASDDRGAVVLLDKRLRNSLYRTEVLRSLPDPTVGYESDIDLFRRVAEWMELPFDPDDLPQPTVTDLARVLAENELSSAYISEDEFETIARPRLMAVQQAVWGHPSFRPGQDVIMRDVIAGKHVLTLLPTGAGKSRTYQLPALIRPGLTLVISPLIALIRDQVEKLREVPGMICVAALVSGMDTGSQEEVLRNAAQGRLKLLYVSPERLRDPRFRAILPRLPLVQLVVDEAHCISTWGHDFRPDFLDIANLLPKGRDGTALPIHALTATATNEVQNEILTTLRMREQDGTRSLSVRSGDFVRNNLVFRVYPVARQEERDMLALGIVHQLVRNTERGGSGIVYVATRRTATQFARLLRDRNIAAQAYHGGLPTPERHQIQERFMQGDLDVVVATSAFGMGVDKAAIRFVLHYDHPASLEAYAQEAGRAGRDGLEAFAILLYHSRTQRTERFIARQGVPSSDVLNAYRRALLAIDEVPQTAKLPDGSMLCDSNRIAQVAGVEEAQARVLLWTFEEAGLIERSGDATLEGTVLLNHSPEVIVQRLSDPQDQTNAAALLAALGATAERQVPYQATMVYAATKVDPRVAEALLVRLAQQDLLIYRPYNRGVLLRLTAALSDETRLTAIEERFAARYARFEDRLQAMLDYIHLRPRQNQCRSAYLVNYLTGQSDAPRCGTCDLCSPTNENLPWDPGVRLYGEPLQIDVRLAILAAVRDHHRVFGRWTIEKMLLGIPQTRMNGQVRQLSGAARASDHFAMLENSGADAERARRTMDVLLEGGYLELIERTYRQGAGTYSAVAITQKGRDALAGGVELPSFEQPEVVA